MIDWYRYFIYDLLGAKLGYSAIEDKWKQDLELSDVILEMADDLDRGCPISEFGSHWDSGWAAKYMDMHRREVLQKQKKDEQA